MNTKARPCSILIVGGNLWQRESLAAALCYEGFQASHASDGAAALAFIAEQPCQLVLINAAASWDTVEKLVMLRPDLPLIVLAPGEEQPGLGAIGLPFNFSVLLGAIHRALSQPAETYVMSLAARRPAQAGSSAKLVRPTTARSAESA